MAKKIFKYQLKTTDIQKVEMPHGARILCLKTQNEIPCIYALVDPAEIVVERFFEIFGTGHNVPGNANRSYVGTYQLNSGPLAFHCFELHSISDYPLTLSQLHSLGK